MPFVNDILYTTGEFGRAKVILRVHGEDSLVPIIPPDIIVGDPVWHIGNGLPVPGMANENDLYLNVGNGDVYRQETGGVWVLKGNIGSFGRNAFGVTSTNFNQPVVGTTVTIRVEKDFEWITTGTKIYILGSGIYETLIDLGSGLFQVRLVESEYEVAVGTVILSGSTVFNYIATNVTGWYSDEF